MTQCFSKKINVWVLIIQTLVTKVFQENGSYNITSRATNLHHFLACPYYFNSLTNPHSKSECASPFGLNSIKKIFFFIIPFSFSRLYIHNKHAHGILKLSACYLWTKTRLSIYWSGTEKIQQQRTKWKKCFSC